MIAHLIPTVGADAEGDLSPLPMDSVSRTGRSQWAWPVARSTVWGSVNSFAGGCEVSLSTPSRRYTFSRWYSCVVDPHDPRCSCGGSHITFWELI